MDWFKRAGQFAREEKDACQAARCSMVETQIVARGVTDARVIAAMRTTPRHLFLPRSRSEDAYGDRALPIDCGQTISQPYMVAVMTEMLQIPLHARVMEIGTGSGYQTAVLAQIADRVVTIERHRALAGEARALLTELGYANVRFIAADGSTGFPDEAPYDGILITAGAPRVPDALLGQLAEGGRLVAPVGNEQVQNLVTVIRQGNAYQYEHGMSCRFVPLVGAQGWNKE